jgi:hypothetical protein
MIQPIPLDLTDSDYIYETARLACERMHSTPELKAHVARLQAISRKLVEIENFVQRMKPAAAPRIHIRTPKATGLDVANIGKEHL